MTAEQRQPAAPPPASISEEAQRYLAALKPRAPYPSPADLQGWRELVARVAAERAAQLAPSLPKLPVKLEEAVMGDAKVYVAEPNNPAPEAKGKAVMFFHGGALVFGSGVTAAAYTCVTALRYGARTFGIDYRVPPDHPYPAALDDCVAAYKALLSRFAARNIAFIGTSAGGNLAAATILRARDEGVAMPGSVVLESPQVDLTESGDSFRTNRDLDPLCGSTAECNALYAAGHDPTDPLVSPLFGDFTKGFPPTLLLSGTRDSMLSNTVRLHRSLRKAGVPADLNVWEAAPHGGFGGNKVPEDQDMFREIKRFLVQHWGRR